MAKDRVGFVGLGARADRADVSEALVLGSRAGVDPATIIEALSGGLAANKVMEVPGGNFLKHDYTTGATA